MNRLNDMTLQHSITRILSPLKRYSLRKKTERLFPDLDTDSIRAALQNNGFSMCPSLLSNMQKIVRERKPAFAVEIGSGISTQILERNLPTGTRLVSVEEKEKFVERTKKLLRNPGRTHFAGNLAEVADTAVDLLIIDGPSGERFDKKSREKFETIISEKTICIIDDTDREENDTYAENIAKQKNLIKKDFSDPLFTRQKYSILFPKENV